MTTVIYSKPISCLSNRNCVLCGERLILFVLEEEQEVSGDQRSFRHVKAVFAQESLTNPDSLPLVVALMAEEDTRSNVSGFTRVDWTTGEPREDPTGGVMRRDAVVDEVRAPSGEPAVTVSGTPDTKKQFQVDKRQVKHLQDRSHQVSRLLDLEGNLR